jgi:mannitol/fructose-specific phosphotransferase system IIA component (Ntr-type)
MNILETLQLDTIKVPLLATDKRGAINELVDVLDKAGVITDADTLRAVVWEREVQRTTGIGEGLAIPHGKCNVSSRLVMAIGVPSQPIEFGSVDKKPVRLIVLLSSPPDKTSDHIQALGKISRLMSDPEFRDKAYAVTSSEELFEMFKHAET